MNLFPDMVRVDSPTFGDDLIGHIQSIRGDFVTVRLELDDDHSAVQDAVADGFSAEQAEFIDHVHVMDVRTTDGVPYGRTPEWAAEKNRQVEAEYQRRLRAARARGRVPLPELDAGLRSRR